MSTLDSTIRPGAVRLCRIQRFEGEGGERVEVITHFDPAEIPGLDEALKRRLKRQKPKKADPPKGMKAWKEKIRTMDESEARADRRHAERHASFATSGINPDLIESDYRLPDPVGSGGIGGWNRMRLWASTVRVGVRSWGRPDSYALEGCRLPCRSSVRAKG